MEDQAIHGVRWTFLAYITSRLLGLIGTLVLAHLLVPREFGLVALALVAIEVASYITGLGLGPAVVIRQDLGRDELGTAFSLLIVTNAITAVVLASFAPAFGHVIQDRQAVPVLVALAAPLLIGGVSSFYDAIMQRELLFQRSFVARTTQSVLSLVVSLTLAVAGAGVWSLVVGRMVGDVTLAVALAKLSPYHTRPKWNLRVVRSLFVSGWGFIIQGVFSFVEQNADYAVVGKALGAQDLGVYSMGFRIGELPYKLMVQPVAQATFPGFARLRERGEDPHPSFLSLLRITSVFVVPFGMLIAGAADPAVRSLLGPRWHAVIIVLPILGMWGSVHALTGVIGWFLSSVGYATRLGAAYAALVVVSIPVLVVAVLHLGIRGAALTMLGNACAALVIGVTITARAVGIPWRRQWSALRPSVVAALPTYVVAAGVSGLLRHQLAGIAVAAAAAASAVAYVAVVSIQDVTLLPAVIRQLRRVARGRAVVDADGLAATAPTW